MLSFSCQKTMSDQFSIDCSFEIADGKFAALYGKSGSGKTTILRMIAGFLTPSSGEIKFADKILFNGSINLCAQKRNIGYLFQDYALFPNMNVMQNLLFANKDRAFADELLSLVELRQYKDASICRLSGGQKQRVALARALMRRPEILLLDEPLSALDQDIRVKLQDYLTQIHQKFKMTTIIVSHDVGEIYKLADIVFEVENGKITNRGTPKEIFLKNAGSQKFSFEAKILNIEKRDSIYIAIIEVGGRIAEIVLTKNELSNLKIGDLILVGAKAFKISAKAIY